jgi:hypothetical protein
MQKKIIITAFFIAVCSGLLAQTQSIPQNIKSAFTGVWLEKGKGYKDRVTIKFEKDKLYATLTYLGAGDATSRIFQANIKGKTLVIPPNYHENDYIELEIIKGQLHFRTRPTVWDVNENPIKPTNSLFITKYFKRFKKH